MKRLVLAAGVLALAIVLLVAMRTGEGENERTAVAPARVTPRPAGRSAEELAAPRVPAEVRELARELAREVEVEVEARPEAARASARVVLSGTVLDLPVGGGVARPGVGVRMAGAVTASRGLAGSLASARTDAAGRFRLELEDPGQRPLRFLIGCDGDDNHGDAHAEGVIAEGDSEAPELVLERYARGVLEGSTVDLSGAPLAGVRLHFGDVRRGAGVEVVSDATGGFRLDRVVSPLVQATRPGYALMRATGIVPRELGGCEPLTVVMARAGAVEVTVVDGAGHPLEGVWVTARVSALEARGRSNRRVDDSTRARPQQRTGGDGSARLTGVWAGQELAVELYIDDRRLVAEQASGGRLAFEPTAGARALVVPEDGVLAVRAELGLNLRLFGRVEDEEGAAVARARVVCRSLDTRVGAAGAIERKVNCDEDGRFELRLLGSEPVARVQLVASEDWPGSRWGRAPKQDALRGCSRVLELGGQASRELELTLTLAPTLEITGRVIGPEAADLRGVLVVQPEQGPLPSGYLPVASSNEVPVGSSGEFRVYGLTPGLYTLTFRPRERYASVTLQHVEAGARDVELRLASERAARVTVELDHPDPEHARVLLLVGELRPWDGGAVDAPPLARDFVQREPEGWPAVAIGLRAGRWTHEDERGRALFELRSVEGGVHELRLEPGLYWLGARARGPGRGRALPVGTGLVRLDAGEYRVRLELAPAARLEGLVRGAGARGTEAGGRCVALARDDGSLVLLATDHGELRATVELGADGSFQVAAAPAGTFELRVGAEAELLAGGALHREPVTLAPDEVNAVELTVAE